MTRRVRWDLRTALILGVVLGVALPSAVLVAVPLPSDTRSLPDRPGATRVSVDPIQCMGNPWEEEWLRSHDNGSWVPYPGEWAAQRAIIVDYYGSLGLSVLDVRRDLWSGGTCDACSCPAGYTLFLQVWDQDVGEFVVLGYEVVP